MPRKKVEPEVLQEETVHPEITDIEELTPAEQPALETQIEEPVQPIHRAERHADGAAAFPPQEICHPVVDSSRGERMECSAIRPVSGDRVVEGDHRLRAGIVVAVHEASGGAGRAAADEVHILFDQPLACKRILLRKRDLIVELHCLTAFFGNCIYHSISAARIAAPPY